MVMYGDGSRWNQYTDTINKNPSSCNEWDVGEGLVGEGMLCSLKHEEVAMGVFTFSFQELVKSHWHVTQKLRCVLEHMFIKLVFPFSFY